MSKQSILYKNETQSEYTLILEPWVEKHTVSPDEEIEIVIEAPSLEHALVIEQSVAGLTIYGYEGSILSVLRK